MQCDMFCAYKSVAFGSAGDFIGDDDGLEDLAIPVEMLPEDVLLRLPCQASDEHLRQRRVAKLLTHRNEVEDEDQENEEEERRERERESVWRGF